MRLTLLVSALATLFPSLALAQICRPISERTAELGCWIIVDEPLGRLPDTPMYWHLNAYPSRAQAEATKGKRGTVIDSLGKFWVFTIDAGGWRPPSGERVAEIGPLPLRTDLEYSAQYKTRNILVSWALKVQNWILSTAGRNSLYKKEITGFDFGYQT